MQLVRLRESTERHQGGDHRDVIGLGEGAQLLVRLGLNDTAADVEHRALGLTNEAHGLLNLTTVGRSDRVVARQVELRWPDEVQLGILHILRHINQHRTRAPGGCQVEGLRHRCRNVLRAGHHEVVLRDRHGHAPNIGLLEGIGTQQTLANLTGDRHEWHGIHVGISDRSDQVRRTWAGGSDTHADLTGDLGVPRGGMAGPLLVAHENVAELFGAIQGLIQREDGATWEAEDHAGPQLFKGTHDRLCAVNALGLTDLRDATAGRSDRGGRGL